MTWTAQPLLTADGQRSLEHYIQVLEQLEYLSVAMIRNYLSELRQFIAWCEDGWRGSQEDRCFTSQAVTTSLLMRYRKYLQTSLRLKLSTVNRTVMSLKRYFAWNRNTQFIQSNPAGPIKFVPKEASPPRHLSDEEDDALVVAVNTDGMFCDQTFITFLLHTGLLAQELCVLTRRQIYLANKMEYYALWENARKCARFCSIQLPDPS